MAGKNQCWVMTQHVVDACESKLSGVIGISKSVKNKSCVWSSAMTRWPHWVDFSSSKGSQFFLRHNWTEYFYGWNYTAKGLWGLSIKNWGCWENFFDSTFTSNIAESTLMLISRRIQRYMRNLFQVWNSGKGEDVWWNNWIKNLMSLSL
jgi:hypothetical protein